MSLTKNAYLLVFFIGILNSGFYSQSGCPSIDLGADTIVDCGVSCINLSAEVFETGSSNTYEVSSIAYNPATSFNGGTSIFVGLDDTWSDVIQLPFNFCFFGNTYNELIVGANGLITFDVSFANTLCAYEFFNPIPSTGPNGGFPPFVPASQGLYQNSINGVYHDIDPSIPGADINYKIFGTAPCRIFSISYDNVAQFDCNNQKSTHQIVLYETTNVIEVYVENKPRCSSWNDGNSLIGIQNETGTVGYTPPGRNTGDWAANNEAWRFTPNGAPNYAVSWYENGTLLGNGLNLNNYCPSTFPSTLNAEIVYTQCDGTTITETDEIIINTSSPNPISVNIDTATICLGDSIALTASGGLSYNWQTDTSLTASTGSDVIAFPSVNTTYTVTANQAGGCTSTKDITILIDQSGSAFFTVAEFCVGQPNVISNIATPGGTFSLTDSPLGATIDANTGVISGAQGDSTYTIEYSVGGSGGCGNTYSETITATNLKNPSFSVSNSCEDTSNTFITILGDSGGIFSFNPPPADGAVIDSLTGKLTNIVGGTDYTIEYAFNTSCPSSEIQTLSVYPIPEASLEYAGNCIGEPVFFTNTSTVSSGSVTGVLWDYGDASQNSTAYEPPHTYTSEGTFDITLIATSDRGCIDIFDTTIFISDFPVANFSAGSGCNNGLPTQFQDESTGNQIVSWDWAFGDGNTSSQQNPSHAYASSGSFKVDLEVTNASNCAANYSENIDITEAPTGQIKFVGNDGCKEACVDLAFETTGQVSTYSWLMGGESSAFPSPRFCFSKEQKYDVKLVVTNANGCSGLFELQEIIEVFPSPTAQIVGPEGKMFLNDAINLRFVDESTNTETRLWNFANGTQSADSTAIITYEKDGIYNIKLTVLSENGCVDTTSSTLEIIPNFSAYIPNSFTPNNDGINDVFFFYGNGYTKDDFKLSIFNRWGDEIFVTEDPLEGWTGKNGKGIVNKQDIYYYKIQVKSISGDLYEYTDKIALIR